MLQKLFEENMAVRAIGPGQTPATTFQCLPCEWINKVCEAIYDLAMKVFNAIKDAFASPQASAPAPAAPVVPRGIAQSPLNIIPFYRGQEANNNGVTLDQILSWDDDRLERVHNFIQWIFPTDIPSAHNSTAPVLDRLTYYQFRIDPALKNQVMRSLVRMLTFYGLRIDERGLIVRGPNFAPRLANFLTNTHNFARISRMLRSLYLVGLSRESLLLQAVMADIAQNEARGRIPQATLDHWARSYN